MTNSELTGRGESDESATLTSTGHGSPEDEYSHRLKGREEQLGNIRIRHQRLWTYLILVGIAGSIVAYVVLSSQFISSLWILLPASMGLFVVQSLTKNARVHSTVQRIVNFYELGISRLLHQWQGLGTDGKEFLSKEHIYASDLDLFGTGSLFELLCTARTGLGRATLANWLLTPAKPDEILQRQTAVAELRDALDLREEWASAGGLGLDRVGSSAVREWADAPAISVPFYAQALAMVLPICLVICSILVHHGTFGANWPYAIAVVVVFELLLAAFLLKKTRLIAGNLISPSFELGLLAPLLERLETEHFQCSLLKSLQLRLTSLSGSPSKQIRILSAWVWLLDLRQSEYFALPGSLILWGTNLTIQIERWRQRNQEALYEWLQSLGEFEALLCLARYYYENPNHSFAILKPHSAPLFDATSLGHPLLDSRTCVQCDVRLDGRSTQLILVSGSNMSGKSTVLRSVGINAVLAYAGAPVCAAQLEISPMQIGCSIAIQDSLLQGRSKFQAEVERLRWMLALSTSGNLLFLLDEVLAGTNSHDRYLGARAVIEQLAGNGAIGLVTTHDLALTEIVKALDLRAVNVHFEEQYKNGEMRFDYRMRPGVLTRSNGLNIMAALGVLPGSKMSETNVTMPRRKPTID